MCTACPAGPTSLSICSPADRWKLFRLQRQQATSSRVQRLMTTHWEGSRGRGAIVPSTGVLSVLADSTWMTKLGQGHNQESRMQHEMCHWVREVRYSSRSPAHSGKNADFSDQHRGVAETICLRRVALVRGC